MQLSESLHRGRVEEELRDRVESLNGGRGHGGGVEGAGEGGEGSQGEEERYENVVV